jgi:PEP-CTERM motif
MTRLLLTLVAVANLGRAATILSEGFDNVAGLGAAGWVMANNSTPGGSTGWFQGNAGVFPSQAGAADSYIAANFLNAGFGGNISNWLLTPMLSIGNGDMLTFYTRSSGFFPDSLELRFSTSGASANVGSTDVSVGDFANLLLTVNPGLAVGYPAGWTQFTATVSGLSGTASGRYAFRYLVPDTSINGDYIGIDSLSVNANVVPEPGTLGLTALGIAGLLALRARARRTKT